MISGVFAPTVTVMTEDGIDIPATRRHIQRLVDSGAHGLCPGGSGGEFVGLTYGERQQIIALGIQASAKRIPVYAGTGCYSTRDTIRLSKWAEAEGADGFMVLVPWLMQPLQQDVADHFRRLRDAVTKPIMIYHPQTTGVQLSLETMVQLVEEARALWSRLTEFVRLEFGPYPAELQTTHIIAVVKAALNAVGVAVGDPLPPIQPLKGAELVHVQQVARSLARLEESLFVG